MSFDWEENKRKRDRAVEHLEKCAVGSTVEDIGEILAHGFLLLDAHLERIEKTQEELAEGLAVIGGEV